MLILSFALFPFALILWMRNKLYDLNILKSYSFPFPVVCVGNLVLGGSGKTPMCLFLAEHFQRKGFDVVILSRGYGRKTKGYININKKHRPEEVGDEPFLMFHRLKNIPVIVCENRKNALEKIKSYGLKNLLVLMDDGFQHRRVKPKISLLLSPASKPFYKDFLFPVGRLRDLKSSHKRSHILCFTKSLMARKGLIEEAVKRTRFSAENMFQTQVGYSTKTPINGTKKEKIQTISAFSGIAHPADFFVFLEQRFHILETKRFPDHHRFSEKDIRKFLEKNQKADAIFITEKDAVKIKDFEAVKTSNIPFYFIPIEVLWFSDEEKKRFLSKISLLLKDE